MPTIVMKPTMDRSRDRSIAAILALTALALPSTALAVGGAYCVRVDPGGTAQLSVPVIDPNDPTPIIIDQVVGPAVGEVGIALGAPEAGGTAVIDGSSAVIRTVSPPDPSGLSSSSTVAVAITVPDAAPAAAIVNVTSGGAASVPDPQATPCDTVQVGAVAPSPVSITSPPTTDLGASPIPLLASTAAIFPVQTQSSAVFAPPASGTFFALALQNPGPGDSVISVELWDTVAGLPVASATLTLPSLTKVSRGISELFPGVVPGAGTVLKVTATVPVQMLGINGNEADGSVRPVLPALASP